VVGQDGRSAWPVGGKIQQTIGQWARRGIGLNAILLVGHGSVRREVMGDANRDPTPEELARMKALVREAMDGGAWGISTGLSYVPGRFAKTEEVIALTAEVKPYGGFYISHLRNQGDRLLESVDETIRIGRETGVTVVATHFKSSGRANFGKARAALERIDAARRAGVRIYTDVYPWATSSDGIDVDVLPAEVYRIAGEPDPDATRAREAVRRATGLAAEIMGLEDRGLLRPGQAADIVIFDPLTIDACATYRNPHCYSRGVAYLLVNGTLAIDQGKYTGALAGRVLLRPRRALPAAAPTGGGQR